LLECRQLVRVLALFGVLENLSGLGIHADFVERLAALDREGIAKAAAAFFLFKLLGGCGAAARFQRNRTGFVYFDLRRTGVLLPVIAKALVAIVAISPSIANRRLRDRRTMNASIAKRGVARHRAEAYPKSGAGGLRVSWLLNLPLSAQLGNGAGAFILLAMRAHTSVAAR